MMTTVLRAVAIAVNVLAVFYWFSYAMAWGPNDYIGGTVSAIPPLLAVVALVLSRPNGARGWSKV